MQEQFNDGNRPTGGGSFDPQLVYHVIFRHKWKIISGLVLGVIASAVCLVLVRPMYQSEARVLVNYVMQSRPINPESRDADITKPSRSGDAIIQSEVQILTSGDSISKVVKSLTAAKIMAKLGGGSAPEDAVQYLLKNIGIDVPNKSDVIRVWIRHPDRAVAQEAVSELVRFYRDKHAEVHGPGVGGEWISKHMQAAEEERDNAERDLRELKTRTKIFAVSLDEFKKDLHENISRLSGQLNQASLSLSTVKAVLQSVTGNQVSGEPSKDSPKPEDLERAEIYQETLQNIARWKQIRDNLRMNLTDQNPRVQHALEEISTLETKKKELEKEDPKLVAMRLRLPDAPGVASSFKIEDAQTRVVELETLIAGLNDSLTNATVRSAIVDAAEPQIIKMEKEFERAQKNVEYYRTLRTQTTLSEALGPNFSSVQEVQKATDPFRDLGKLKKAVAMSLALGLGLGIGLALLSEFVLDQTVKRPVELETLFNMPLFVTIPAADSKDSARLKGTKRKALPGPTGDAQAKGGKGHLNGVASGVDAGMRPYLGALRDRTIMYLERMTHKPKLIAVTGCTEGAGTTTVATGLAKALSETAEGRVLVVDMNHGKGEMHPFLNGKPVCGIADALESETRENGLVQENLYIASASDEQARQLPMVPKRFASLIPRLKTSDYDYVIFDMPPVSPTSITPRLAGLMDIVLLVVESEKARLNTVRRASNVLSEARANVATVLNKQKTYIPKWLYQEP